MAVYGLLCLLLLLLVWRVSDLSGSPEKARRPLPAAPVVKRGSEVQEWLRQRDLEERRSQRQARVDPEE